MRIESPTWTLTGEINPETNESKTIDVTVRSLTGARARNTVPEILEVLTAFASTEEGTQFIASLLELGQKSQQEQGEGDGLALIDELPRIIYKFATIVKPVLHYFETNALFVMTTATPEILDEYGTFPEVCLMVYQAIVYHYKTSMTPQVGEALKKFSNALTVPVVEQSEDVTAAA